MFFGLHGYGIEKKKEMGKEHNLNSNHGHVQLRCVSLYTCVILFVDGNLGHKLQNFSAGWKKKR
jgi:hypothetical protein